MTRRSFSLTLPGLYLALFFAYLFGPLFIMVVTAFNSSGFPRITPWECFTTNWFHKLAADGKLLEGIGNSLIIGLGVVCVAIPIGLAAAIMLSQVGPKLRTALYTLFIAPILVPGVVIGLSTLIFWDRIGTWFGASYDSFLYDGLFLTVLGQVTFIAAYSMLVFLSRIQRFDVTLTEAALDMGATPTQAFFKVLLPFMAPAIGSAAVLAFLASMENYNTTVFTIVSASTFTTVLASKVRYGLDPSISSVAVIIIGLTIIATIIYESHKRRDTGWSGKLAGQSALRMLFHPASVAGILLVLVLGAVWFIGRYDSSACEAQILDEKRALQQELMEQQKATQAAPQEETAPATTAPATQAPGNSIFAPQNLQPPAPETTAPATQAPANSVFSPGNLTAPSAPSD